MEIFFTKRVLKFVCIIFVLFGFYWQLVMYGYFMAPWDFSINKRLEAKKLKTSEYILVSEIVDFDWKKVCVLYPYEDLSSIKESDERYSAVKNLGGFYSIGAESRIGTHEKQNWLIFVDSEGNTFPRQIWMKMGRQEGLGGTYFRKSHADPKDVARMNTQIN